MIYTNPKGSKKVSPIAIAGILLGVLLSAILFLDLTLLHRVNQSHETRIEVEDLPATPRPGHSYNVVFFDSVVYYGKGHRDRYFFHIWGPKSKDVELLSGVVDTVSYRAVTGRDSALFYLNNN